MFQIQNSYNLPLTTQPVIYIGYDFREHKAVRVLQHSISTHSTVPIYTKTLNLTNLRRSGLYRRAPHHDSTCWSKTKFGRKRTLVKKIFHVLSCGVG